MQKLHTKKKYILIVFKNTGLLSNNLTRTCKLQLKMYQQKPITMEETMFGRKMKPI